MFNTTVVWEANHNSTADICINQGGTDSTKTYSILQECFWLGIFDKLPESDPIITVLSASVPNSKKGAYRVAQSIAHNNDFIKSQIKHWHESERIIYFKSGWILEFVGATTEQNAKQGKRQYLFANEANGIPWLIFWQMAKRTRIRTWIDYNPSAPFWAHEKLIGTLPENNDLNAEVQLIISDHRHNPFLSQKDHDRTENIKDPELWKVYARGITGNLEGLIYPNWKIIPDKDFPWDDDSKFGGVDFGYTNDPTAGVRLCRIANQIFVHQLCYETGLGARKLQRLYYGQKFNEEHPVYCEHDKDQIRELRELDILAIPARKGPGSIKSGIFKVQEYEILVTASSEDIEYERKRYMWMKDPTTGKSLNVPYDKNNHLMDAIRYGISSHFYHKE